MQIFKALLPVVALAAMSQLSAQEEPPADSRLALEELRNFTRVFEQVRQAYVEELSDEEIFSMAIRGMLQELDPHSDYLTLVERNELRDTAEGRFSGIGVELSMQGDNLTVVTPIDGSPAARANIQPGDVIVAVDGESIEGFSFRQAIEALEGEAGEPVVLTILREGSRGARDVELTRERILVGSVSHQVLSESVGYLRVAQFSDNTAVEFRQALEELLAKPAPLAGLVIDLRNNPGGLLRGATDIADLFLSSGTIVSTRGRIEQANQVFRASPETLADHLPIVVLINRGSASAAEIVAGALQDHGRAILLGDVSFGKGSVQEVLSVDETSAIKLTIARYYTPSGRSIQARGIYPDIRVDRGSISWQTGSNSLTEAALSRSLASEDGAPKMVGLRQTLSDIEDAQLAQAVSLLLGNQLLRLGQ